MKFLVDSLPYYNENACPFVSVCEDFDMPTCPMVWTKTFVNSDRNPHECEYLREPEPIKEEAENWC